MLFDKSEYLERLNKTKKTMQKKGLDVLITTDPSNMYYITGYILRTNKNNYIFGYNVRVHVESIILTHL